MNDRLPVTSVRLRTYVSFWLRGLKGTFVRGIPAGRRSRIGVGGTTMGRTGGGGTMRGNAAARACAVRAASFCAAASCRALSATTAAAAAFSRAIAASRSCRTLRSMDAFCWRATSVAVKASAASWAAVAAAARALAAATSSATRAVRAATTMASASASPTALSAHQFKRRTLVPPGLDQNVARVFGGHGEEEAWFLANQFESGRRRPRGLRRQLDRAKCRSRWKLCVTRGGGGGFSPANRPVAESHQRCQIP